MRRNDISSSVMRAVTGTRHQSIQVSQAEAAAYLQLK